MHFVIYSAGDEIQPINVEMEDVEFVMHCPHDYFYDHDINFMKWNPEPGTVYQRLGDKLILVEKVKVPIVNPENEEEETEVTPVEEKDVTAVS